MNLHNVVNRTLSNRIIRLVYALYKKREIIKALEGTLDINGFAEGYGLGLDERIIEYPWLFSRLPSTNGSLLDAGSVLNFDYILGHPKLTQKKIFISTLAPEKHSFWRKSISYLYEDMRDICFKDNFFDWIVCLSVIEHIGLDNTKFYTTDIQKHENKIDSYLKVICELHRTLKPGGSLYLSVPFGIHRNYGWLQTFDGSMISSILDTFSPASYSEYHYRYSTNGWKTSSREESARCEYFDLHDKRRKYRKNQPIAAGAVACLELKK